MKALLDEELVLFAPGPVRSGNTPPEPNSPTRRQRDAFVVRGSHSGRMYFGGWSPSVLRHPIWRLWPKNAVRFKTREHAEEVARRTGGTVEVRP